MTDRQTPQDDAVDELLAHVDDDLDTALDDALDIETGLAATIPSVPQAELIKAMRERAAALRQAASPRPPRPFGAMSAGGFGTSRVMGAPDGPFFSQQHLAMGGIGSQPAMAGAGTGGGDADHHRASYLANFEDDLFDITPNKNEPPVIGI
ncbi:hypothetical protein [Kibdelosporangium phytohabitans]|uniref:Uncharacterized protein n=1 Tax=Kibdelosporangium phytohabitans TaxID=860235 RepID=A0A0N7F4N1_9PSEU|nr:hypothetical protein [Kibdelosporangium phytohabitans]ALG11895.1 hypothetical protein AOZ06_38020 [Kibdelosporangium phytohabitans]MBE1463342.1 hypothetical protein [Kibdelosporangium phytohabitans]